MDPLKGRKTKESGCSWQKSSLTFGCARHKLMTHYVYAGTVRDQAARQASRYDRENEAVLSCRHTYVNAFGRRQYLPDVMDYLSIGSITVCGKSNYLISAEKVRQWRDVTGLPMCNGLDAISSGGVLTGTGFRSVAKPDCTQQCWWWNAQTSVAGIVRCWKGIDLMGAVSWFGVEKWVTRRRTLLSCNTISMHYIDDVLCPHTIPFLHYFYT